MSSVLVTAEMALAVVLLAGAGVLVHSLLKLMAADKGLRVTNVLTLGLSLPSDKYPTSETQISFFDSLKARLEAVPGVESVAYGTPLPGQRAARFPYEFADAAPVDVDERPLLWALTVSPSYFRTLGATVLAGREFNDSDGVSGIPVVIVNQRFAKQYWPDENPLGKRLRLFKGTAPQAWLSVIGVVSNIVQNSAMVQDVVDPLVYLPYRENPTAGMWVFARTRVPSESVGLVFRSEIRSLDSDLPIHNLMTLDYWFKWEYLDSSIVTAMFLIFAAIALLLASFGLYAVIAHLVSQRTQEIGVGMAIGATAGDILKLVLQQGMLPLGVGLTIGLAASFALNPILKSVLIQVSPTDPIAFALASGALVLSALVGCWIPVRRALRVDPVVALRHE